MSKIDDIKPIIEEYFKISNIEWDRTAAAFYIENDAGVLDRFEKLRNALKEKGYIAALRTAGEGGAGIEERIKELAVTPQLKEILERIKEAKEPDVKMAWEDRFFELARCPKCGMPLMHQGNELFCPSCGWGKKSEEIRYVVVVTHMPRIEGRSIYVNISLLILTIITTTITGATIWMAYRNVPFGGLLDTMWTATTTPEYIAMGALYFALPLMTILGIHELGHYFMSRHHGVSASLPFFIPLPPGISPLGTMGAFISMREPMPNKKVLFDIGIAGPIAGLIVAIPVTIIGFLLTEPTETVYTAGHGPNVAIGFPLLFQWLSMLVQPDGNSLHPTAFAGWVGLFITALNLLPAGQLDGGHVARALLGENSRYLSYAVIGGMFFVGFLWFSGWILLAVLILILGARHPPPLNDIAQLDNKRKALGVFSIVLLVICFTVAPLVPLHYDLHVFAEETEANIQPGGMVNFTLFIENTGEVNNTYDIKNSTMSNNWNVTLSKNNITLASKDSDPEKSRGSVIITIRAPDDAKIGDVERVKITVKSQNESATTMSAYTPVESITFVLHVRNPYDFNMTVSPPLLNVTANSTEQAEILLNNTGSMPIELNTRTVILSGEASRWKINLSAPDNLTLKSGESVKFVLNITALNGSEGERLDIAVLAFSEKENNVPMRAALITAVCPGEEKK